MLAKLTLSTLLTPRFVPMILSQYAGSLTGAGPVCGPKLTPGAGVGVISLLPGVAVTEDTGAVNVGVTTGDVGDVGADVGSGVT